MFSIRGIQRSARLATGLPAIIGLIRDPDRLDDVVTLGRRLVDDRELRDIVARAREVGPADAFRERRRIHLNTAELQRLAPGTLGREMGDFLAERGLNPADLPSLPATDDGSYFRAHMYETHDLWHIATGFGTDPAGELGLQAFYVAQMRAPLGLALLAVGLINTLVYERGATEARMDAITHGWQLGKAARPLFGYDWKANLERPLADVRRDLGLSA